MMMRSEDYRRFTGFREDMFMYFEDAELCWRMRKAGLQVWLVPDAEVYHHVSVSSGGIYSPFAVYYSLRNRCVFGRELLSPAGYAAFRLYVVAMVLTKSVLFPLSGKAATVPVMWRAMLDGFAGRMGSSFGVENPAPKLEWEKAD
jgi:GT2 family glycosyltransferase